MLWLPPDNLYKLEAKPDLTLDIPQAMLLVNVSLSGRDNQI
jgi:hypothetical protein